MNNVANKNFIFPFLFLLLSSFKINPSLKRSEKSLPLTIKILKKENAIRFSFFYPKIKRKELEKCIKTLLQNNEKVDNEKNEKVDVEKLTLSMDNELKNKNIRHWGVSLVGVGSLSCLVYYLVKKKYINISEFTLEHKNILHGTSSIGGLLSLCISKYLLESHFNEINIKLEYIEEEKQKELKELKQEEKEEKQQKLETQEREEEEKIKTIIQEFTNDIDKFYTTINSFITDSNKLMKKNHPYNFNEKWDIIRTNLCNKNKKKEINKERLIREINTEFELNLTENFLNLLFTKKPIPPKADEYNIQEMFNYFYQEWQTFTIAQKTIYIKIIRLLSQKNNQEIIKEELIEEELIKNFEDKINGINNEKTYHNLFEKNPQEAKELFQELQNIIEKEKAFKNYFGDKQISDDTLYFCLYHDENNFSKDNCNHFLKKIHDKRKWIKKNMIGKKSIMLSILYALRKINIHDNNNNNNLYEYIMQNLLNNNEKIRNLQIRTRKCIEIYKKNYKEYYNSENITFSEKQKINNTNLEKEWDKKIEDDYCLEYIKDTLKNYIWPQKKHRDIYHHDFLPESYREDAKNNQKKYQAYFDNALTTTTKNEFMNNNEETDKENLYNDYIQNIKNEFEKNSLTGEKSLDNIIERIINSKEQNSEEKALDSVFTVFSYKKWEKDKKNRETDDSFDNYKNNFDQNLTQEMNQKENLEELISTIAELINQKSNNNTISEIITKINIFFKEE